MYANNLISDCPGVGECAFKAPTGQNHELFKTRETSALSVNPTLVLDFFFCCSSHVNMCVFLVCFNHLSIENDIV